MTVPPLIYKVRFLDEDKTDPIELLVRSVEPSSFPGLLRLEGLILEESTIIRPDIAKLSERYRGTYAIHVPYHNILSIEEREDDAQPPDTEPLKLTILTDQDAPPSEDEN